MPSTQTIVIGAGQAGLAASRCLTDAGVDHVVLERGRLAERWRSERWDSLRLLSPNWATRLPHWRYRGADPDGFMAADDFAGYLQDYARSFDAPVQEATTVRRVSNVGDGFVVQVSEGDSPDGDDAGVGASRSAPAGRARTWTAHDVIIATGWCDQPRVPGLAAGLDPAITQLTPTSYRNPAQLAPGGVLIVGASASGVQLADELARAGREVVLAVGRHSRVPRRYRGRDIWRWLEPLGTFATTIDAVADPDAARHEGSLPLVGRADGRDVDLPALAALGVQLVGRLLTVDGARAQFADDLATTMAAADDRHRRLLADIDDHIRAACLSDVVPAPEPPRPLPALRPQPALDLRRSRIGTVIWATGYTRPYPWLAVPVLDAAGEISQHRGITPVPGLYVLGQRFGWRRDANFIDGVRHDATSVTAHLARHRHAGAGLRCVTLAA